MKIYNKKAKFNYAIIETLEAGIMLTGPEVKSVRSGRVDLSESFARVQNNEVFAKNIYIPPYLGQRLEDYNPRRDRKLLLHRNQIIMLFGKLSKGGMALIPLSIYTTRNLIKIELAIGASKKKVDKRRVIKERDEARKLAQELASTER